MKIELTKDHKIELLKALKTGVLDTDVIPELKEAMHLHEPARILTKKEAKELIEKLEENY